MSEEFETVSFRPANGDASKSVTQITHIKSGKTTTVPGVPTAPELAGIFANLREQYENGVY